MTKAAAEDLCQLAHRNHGLPCVVLRIDFTPRLDQLEHAVDEREAAYQREVFDALPAADQALIRGVEAELSARNAALFRENVELKRKLREARDA